MINPRVPLLTADVFAGWDGSDYGPLGDWREGRNDLQAAAIALAPQIETVLAWLGTRPGASFVRMSGSGATCFALFDSEEARDLAADWCRASGGAWRPACAKARAMTAPDPHQRSDARRGELPRSMAGPRSSN